MCASDSHFIPYQCPSLLCAQPFAYIVCELRMPHQKRTSNIMPIERKNRMNLQFTLNLHCDINRYLHIYIFIHIPSSLLCEFQVSKCIGKYGDWQSIPSSSSSSSSLLSLLMPLLMMMIVKRKCKCWSRWILRISREFIWFYHMRKPALKPTATWRCICAIWFTYGVRSMIAFFSDFSLARIRCIDTVDAVNDDDAQT